MATKTITTQEQNWKW